MWITSTPRKIKFFFFQLLYLTRNELLVNLSYNEMHLKKIQFINVTFYTKFST